MRQIPSLLLVWLAGQDAVPFPQTGARQGESAGCTGLPAPAGCALTSPRDLVCRVHPECLVR